MAAASGRGAANGVAQLAVGSAPVMPWARQCTRRTTHHAHAYLRSSQGVCPTTAHIF